VRGGRTATGAGGSIAGRFYSGTDSWRHFDGLRRFACESALPGLVAALLRSSKVNLYEDSILIKEPGTPDKTYFHQDISYFHVEGEQICTSWLPVDPVTEVNGGLQFIKSSHRWVSATARITSSPTVRWTTRKARSCRIFMPTVATA
jgi:ectoine hydroxylase-related dioxygenase (phytanoyl-CoA dioxygenase family)